MFTAGQLYLSLSSGVTGPDTDNAPASFFSGWNATASNFMARDKPIEQGARVCSLQIIPGRGPEKRSIMTTQTLACLPAAGASCGREQRSMVTCEYLVKVKL